MERVTKQGASLSALAALGLAVAMMPSPAWADIMSFTYSDLNGSFSTGTNNFTAVNQGITDGDVTRLEGPPMTANFDYLNAGIGSSSFTLDLDVSAITAATASSTGTLVITDVDGDQWTADVSGNWVNVAGSANLNGILSNVQPLSTGDGVFEGTTGAFSMAFATPMPYFGNIITLVFGGWFSDGAGTPSNFSERNVLASGQVTSAIPSPSALLLGMVGLAVMVVRHRPRVTA
jgi:hypothetical protein